jgi:hypothetical protein
MRRSALALLSLALFAGCGVPEEGDAASAHAQELIIRPLQVINLPDLTIRFVEAATTGDVFEIFNRGTAETGMFKVAVLANSKSYSFHLFRLAPGASYFHSMQGMECGQGMNILVDVNNTELEVNETNNAIQRYHSCRID